MKTISIDAMGGDFGPSVTVPAALQVLRKHPNLQLIFVGLTEPLQSLLSTEGADVASRWEICSATETVAMDETVSSALRSKKDSSMRVAINLVKEGRAQACVSAGNTGALMATARFVLKTLPGVDRPALMARFPTKEQHIVRVLDLGANVDSLPHHLFQFAVMGATAAIAVDNIPKPTVALLNIGSEDIKGNTLVKESAQLLSHCSAINYIGYVEGDDIFFGVADIVVCDGFVGNAVLKACEGTLRLIAQFAQNEIKKNWLSKLAIVPAIPIINRIKNNIDPRTRNGATLLGLNGTVMKSHGGADKYAFSCAIEQALLEIEKNVPELIREQVSNILL